MSSHSSLNHIYRTVWNQALGAMVAVAEIASGRVSSGGGASGSGVGGPSRLAALPLCIAVAWGAASGSALANPSGGVAVAGQANMVSTGNNLLVNTQNAAGANHSAINWQSFSIPQGNATHFQQPNAGSTVINRVVTHTPTQIFGNLSSNGNLVLVNQAGIAVGAGAVVDTAGFTASALRMTDADALSGRLRFGDAAVPGAGVSVGGSVLARSGDVVLLGSNVDTSANALVQSPNGSTILAAGQQVELTGRGLEGIRLQVQAPADAVVNLGTLKGDAVGIFAGTLKHSGVIQATTASLEGGRVVLKAAGDAYVQGAGQIMATGGAGQTGGSVDVLGSRVAVMDQAHINVSGGQGGGAVRVGGDYQGKNAEVPNANFVFFGPQASIQADAIVQGEGGRVIAWADDTTRAHGHISAQGGVKGGNGGFVETSGKQSLDVAGVRVDTRTSNGETGLWLLDPNNIEIVATGTTSAGTAPNFSAGALTSTLGLDVLLPALNGSDVSVTAGGNLTVSSAISDSGNATKNNLSLTASSGILAVDADISLTNKDLALESTAGSINLNSHLSLGTGTLKLRSDTAISQNVTKVITAANLSVESVGTTGGNVSLSGTNLVDTFAASRTNGSGGLSLVNGQSLTVGTVGSVVGVTVANNPVGINISTTTGNLTINQPVLSGATLGGPISLTAANGLSINKAVTSQTSVVPVGPVILAGGTGISSHFTDGIITTAGLKATSGCCVNLIAPNVVTTLAGTSVGSFSFTSAGGFAVGTVDSTNGITTNGGNLSLTASGTMTAGDITTKGGSVNLTGTGISGVAIDTSPTTVGGNGGSVTITATSGSVSGQTIQTLGVAGSPNTSGSGGNVSVTATTGISITGNLINTDADSTVANTSGQAGNVSLTTTGGNITVGPVYSRGTPGQAAQNRNGGTVTISAPAGIVTATGVIQAQGMSGGNITLSGAEGVNFQGALDTSSGAAPNGRAVTLSATSYPVSDNSTGYVKSDVLNISANGVTLNNSLNNVASLSITPNGTSPISYWDADAFSLGPLTFTGSNSSLTFKSTNGNVTQSGALIANGLNTLTTLESGSGNVTLDNLGNDFTALNASATNGAVDIKDASGVTINNIFAKTINLDAVGDINIIGNTQATSTSGLGVSVNASAGDITVGTNVVVEAATGDIVFTAGGSNNLMTVGSLANVRAFAGNVSYLADNVYLTGVTSSGTAAGKFIEIKPFTTATAIEFEIPATGDTAGVLRLSSTELATLTTPLLKVGNISNTGGIQFKQAVTLAPGKVPALSLITSGAIGQGSTASVSVDNFNAHGMAGVALNEANYVSVNLAGRTGTGAFSFSNGSNSIQVGPVDVVNNGIVSDSGGAISLATTLGSISTVGTGIIKTAGALTANSYAGMSLKTEVGTLNAVDLGNSADVVVSNGGANAPILNLGTLTPGTGRRWVIYVDDPSKLVKAGKASDFREYGKTYPSAPLPANAGNGFIYASVPGQLQVNTTLQSGVASNTFGVAPTAVFSYSITNPAGADSEDIAIATAGTASFTPTVTSSTNAGAYTISYAGGKTHPVYSVVAGTGLAYTVNAAPVSVNTLSLSGTRVYDGTDVVNGSIFSISGLVGSDTLVLSGSGTVADKNVGVNKPVTLGTLALANGTGLASNYTLTGGTHVATITKAPITGVTGITATNRPYDGTLVAALTTSGAVLAGMASNDNLSVTSAKGAFENKNVGDAKAVNVSDLVFGGTDVDNYTFSSATASPTKANITPRPLSTWKGPSNGGNWSDPTNWDALPDASNVTSVALPSAGTVVYDAAMGSTTLQSLSGAGTLAVAGGSLTVATAVSLQGYQQTAGALATQGAVTVTNSFSQTGGTVVAGGAVAITQASGDLAAGSITAPTISLKANGSISQTAGLVTAGLLSTQSGGGTVLNNAANRVGAFQAASTGAGNIELTNVGALDVRGLRTASGSIVMRNTGGISTSGPVVARGGKITGVANSPLTIGADGVSADGDISLTATNLTSEGNLTLNGSVVSSGGAITLTAAANLTQNSTVSAALGVTSSAGGTTVFGPNASTVGAPVSYVSNGLPTQPPASTTVPPVTPTPTDPTKPPDTQTPTDPNKPPVTPTPTDPTKPPDTQTPTDPNKPPVTPTPTDPTKPPDTQTPTPTPADPAKPTQPVTNTPTDFVQVFVQIFEETLAAQIAAKAPATPTKGNANPAQATDSGTNKNADPNKEPNQDEDKDKTKERIVVDGEIC